MCVCVHVCVCVCARARVRARVCGLLKHVGAWSAFIKVLSGDMFNSLIGREWEVFALTLLWDHCDLVLPIKHGDVVCTLQST